MSLVKISALNVVFYIRVLHNFAYIFYIFCPILIKFSTDVHKTLLAHYEFHLSWCSNSHTLLGCWDEFHVGEMQSMSFAHKC